VLEVPTGIVLCGNGFFSIFIAVESVFTSEAIFGADAFFAFGSLVI
jgi:hypothetical protein